MMNKTMNLEIRRECEWTMLIVLVIVTVVFVIPHLPPVCHMESWNPTGIRTKAIIWTNTLAYPDQGQRNCEARICIFKMKPLSKLFFLGNDWGLAIDTFVGPWLSLGLHIHLWPPKDAHLTLHFLWFMITLGRHYHSTTMVTSKDR